MSKQVELLPCASITSCSYRKTKSSFFPNKIENEKLDFDEFLQMLEQNWKTFDSKEELRNAFSALDKNGLFACKLVGLFSSVMSFDYWHVKGNGYVTQDEFKEVMLTLGEKLTDDEMHDMIKDCNVNTDGTINYEGISLRQT